MGKGSVYTENGERKYVNKSERLLFHRATQDLPIEKKVFCLTLLHTGCRISEALGLFAHSVDVTEMTIIFRTLKRRSDNCFRQVPVPPNLIELYREILFHAEPEYPLFLFSRSTGYRAVKRAMRDAQIIGAKACPKGLRHGFGMGYVSERVNAANIQKWMGHARPESTSIYLDAMEAEEKALAARLWEQFELDILH